MDLPNLSSVCRCPIAPPSVVVRAAVGAALLLLGLPAQTPPACADPAQEWQRGTPRALSVGVVAPQPARLCATPFQGVPPERSTAAKNGKREAEESRDKSDARVVVEDGFEAGLSGWAPLWTREQGAGQVQLDQQTSRAGRQAVRIEQRGQQDWSFHRVKTHPAVPGEIYQLSAWLRVEGSGSATLGVVLRGENDRVIDWSFGGVSVGAGRQWQRVESRLSDDRAVQQTEFANGVVVTVNFGERPFEMSDGFVIEPLGVRTEGLAQEQ